VDQAASDAQQDASAAAASARSKWAQMKADAAAKMDDLQARAEPSADRPARRPPDGDRTRACAYSITLRGNQARLRLPP
jgi:hypothetical protein